MTHPILNGDHAAFELERGNTPLTHRPDWPLSSFDARDWARAFNEQYPGQDTDVMVAWFANALMRGFDEGQGRIHHGLTLDDYQAGAISTAVYPGRGEVMGKVYCGLKMNGEAGEVAEKLGKILRDDEGVITPERRESLMKAMGDVLWYVAALAGELGYDLSEVAQANLDKLQGRKQRGTLKGSGDDR